MRRALVLIATLAACDDHSAARGYGERFCTAFPTHPECGGTSGGTGGTGGAAGGTGTADAGALAGVRLSLDFPDAGVRALSCEPVSLIAVSSDGGRVTLPEGTVIDHTFKTPGVASGLFTNEACDSLFSVIAADAGLFLKSTGVGSDRVTFTQTNSGTDFESRAQLALTVIDGNTGCLNIKVEAVTLELALPISQVAADSGQFTVVPALYAGFGCSLAGSVNGGAMFTGAFSADTGPDRRLFFEAIGFRGVNVWTGSAGASDPGLTCSNGSTCKSRQCATTCVCSGRDSTCSGNGPNLQCCSGTCTPSGCL